MSINNKTIYRSFRAVCLAFVMVIGVMSIVASSGSGGGGDSTSDSSSSDSSSNDSSSSETDDDGSDFPEATSFIYEDDDANPTTITFGSISITGDTASATYSGNIVTINSPGTFNIIGTIADGQIKVNTLEEGDVRLVFQGADISCSFGPPIDIENAERVIVRLESGTDNYLTDTHTSVVYDEDAEEIDAALYSKEDLVISGAGSLTVVTDYKDGIKSKDSLIFDSGTVNVTAADDGISGKNFISVEYAAVNIVAGGDGMKSTQDGDAGGGYIYITDGDFDIDAGADAIQVETHIVIADGFFDLTTAGGSNSTTSDTAKGLKSPVGITIYGGDFIIDSADDSIHSNDSIEISGGSFALYSADDAIHADTTITIDDGTINIYDCYEGIEGKIITINDGEIHVESSDDPINGSDGSGGQSASGVAIYINGGYIYLECVRADGFDSNGAVYLAGGTVVINGPVSGGNGILDYGSFTTTGGTLIGAGTSDMAQAPGGDTSTQNSLLFMFSQKSAGTLFHIETDDGTEVLTFAPAKTYGAIVLTSPLLTTGTTITVSSGGTYTGGTVKDGVYTGGSYSGGTEMINFTISYVVTYIY